jgi:transposase
MQENVQMPQKTRRVFTDEQKAAAVNIVKQSGKPVSQVAKEMGLTESALRNWVKQSQMGASHFRENMLRGSMKILSLSKQAEDECLSRPAIEPFAQAAL